MAGECESILTAGCDIFVGKSCPPQIGAGKVGTGDISAGEIGASKIGVT